MVRQKIILYASSEVPKAHFIESLLSQIHYEKSFSDQLVVDPHSNLGFSKTKARLKFVATPGQISSEAHIQPLLAQVFINSLDFSGVVLSCLDQFTWKNPVFFNLFLLPGDRFFIKINQPNVFYFFKHEVLKNSLLSLKPSVSSHQIQGKWLRYFWRKSRNKHALSPVFSFRRKSFILLDELLYFLVLKYGGNPDFLGRLPFYIKHEANTLRTFGVKVVNLTQ